MLFNSSAFLVFFGLFISLWPLLRARNNLRWTNLTIASLVFYGWWDWRFLFLIAGSGLIDYFAALGMVRFPQPYNLDRGTLYQSVGIVNSIK